MFQIAEHNRYPRPVMFGVDAGIILSFVTIDHHLFTVTYKNLNRLYIKLSAVQLELVNFDEVNTYIVFPEVIEAPCGFSNLFPQKTQCIVSTSVRHLAAFQFGFHEK